MTDCKEIIEVTSPGPYYLCKLVFFLTISSKFEEYKKKFAMSVFVLKCKGSVKIPN